MSDVTCSGALDLLLHLVKKNLCPEQAVYGKRKGKWKSFMQSEMSS